MFWEFLETCYSAGWFVRAENSMRKNIINFHFPCGQKKKKDIKIALNQQHCTSSYVNWYVSC